MRSLVLLLLMCGASVMAQMACNGYPELCSRRYSNVSQIGSHDSCFVGNLPQENQDSSVLDQLNSGIRFLTAQTHMNILRQFSLCHTSCFELDVGKVEDYLATLKQWLDSNPNEVLTLLLVNGDHLDPSVFDKVMTSSGLKSYSYVPPSSPAVLHIDAWPTLGDMIASGKRLVFFIDFLANMTEYPYILDEFSYFFETPYDTTDPNFAQCILDRPPKGTPQGRMYIVNHFLDKPLFDDDKILVPDRKAINTTNAATGPGSIGAQVSLCESTYRRPPKAVLVDFASKGEVFVAQKAMNRL